MPPEHLDGIQPWTIGWQIEQDETPGCISDNCFYLIILVGVRIVPCIAQCGHQGRDGVSITQGFQHENGLPTNGHAWVMEGDEQKGKQMRDGEQTRERLQAINEFQRSERKQAETCLRVGEQRLQRGDRSRIAECPQLLESRLAHLLAGIIEQGDQRGERLFSLI